MPDLIIKPRAESTPWADRWWSDAPWWFKSLVVVVVIRGVLSLPWLVENTVGTVVG